MRLYLLILTIVVISNTLRDFIAEHFLVINPGSNHLGWYVWSLCITALRWEWYVAIVGRYSQLTCCHIVVAIAVAACLSYTPNYSQLVYGATLTATSHAVMNGLHLVLETAESAGLLILSMSLVRYSAIVPVGMLLVAAKVFAYDCVPVSNPFISEFIDTSIIVSCYFMLLMIFRRAYDA